MECKGSIQSVQTSNKSILQTTEMFKPRGMLPILKGMHIKSKVLELKWKFFDFLVDDPQI